MRYEYLITDIDKNTETIKAMSFKKLLKKLSSKYQNKLVQIKYINKHKNELIKLIKIKEVKQESQYPFTITKFFFIVYVIGFITTDNHKLSVII